MNRCYYFHFQSVHIFLVHFKRLHARRLSSTSQAGQNSLDQGCPQAVQAIQTNKHHPALTSLQFTPETEREAEEVEGRAHQPINATQPCPVPAATATPVTASSAIATIIPPFAVREPVEKQVRNWLESTSDEYDILLKRLVKMEHYVMCPKFIISMNIS